MVATVILSMLCVHLFCFCVMFYLISTRLHEKRMGMEVFALGNLLLGCAYILQLFGGPSGWSAISAINHTLTLCAPIAYVLGAFRFFNRSTLLWKPLLGLAAAYTVLQILVQYTLGPVVRHALLSAACAIVFLVIAGGALYGTRTFAKDLKVEMYVIALLIAGICGLNAAKFVIILRGGLEALEMSTQFQMVFYIYMSFLGTVLPPTIVWLVFRRLTDELRTMAARDPLTQLLNRRGLSNGLDTHFRTRNARAARLLMVDIDHFKQINDTFGHKTGDQVLCHVAKILQHSTRQGDLVCRLGGEEFVIVCLDTDEPGAMQLAERIRAAIAQSEVATVPAQGTIRCTVTIGVSHGFISTPWLEQAMQQADAALYRGKAAGRNRVERIDQSGVQLPHPFSPDAKQHKLSQKPQA